LPQCLQGFHSFFFEASEGELVEVGLEVLATWDLVFSWENLCGFFLPCAKWAFPMTNWPDEINLSCSQINPLQKSSKVVFIDQLDISIALFLSLYEHIKIWRQFLFYKDNERCINFLIIFTTHIKLITIIF
jgi:hypothetical protein